MKKYYSKNLSPYLISMFVLIMFFGMMPQKISAEETTSNTITKTGATTTNANKVSPYSIIKERIQDLQKKLKIDTEQNSKSKIINKICDNDVEEIRSYLGGEVFSCNNYYKVIPSINLADAPTVVLDKNGTIVARCGGMPLSPDSKTLTPKECSLSCESKALCVITSTTKEINARKQPLINAVKNIEKVENKGEEKQISEEAKEQKKEEIKQKLEESSIKRIRAYTEKIVNRFNAVMERFVTLSNRAEDRIKKIEEGGILLTDSKVLLSKTREEIASTKIKIGEISKKIEEIILSENPKEMFKNSKEIFNDVNESIKTVHKSLVELIKSIKAGVGEGNDSTKLEN